MTLPPPPPLPLDRTAAVAVLTQLSLLQHVTSFQQGYAVLFAPALRIYYAAGHRLRAPRSMEEYPNITNGEDRGQLAAAHVARHQPREPHLLDGHSAIEHGNTVLVSWLLARRVDVPDLYSTGVDMYVQLACLHHQVGILEVLLEHLGREHIQRTVAPAFANIVFEPVNGALDVLRWLDALGIRPSLQVVADNLVPIAISRARRGVIEYFLATGGFRLTQLDPDTLVRSLLNRAGRPRDRDEAIAALLAWAMDEHGMPVNIRVVQSLLALNRFKSAKVVVLRGAQTAPPLATGILNDVVAAFLVREAKVEAIKFVLRHFPTEHATVLVDDFRIHIPTFDVVEAILVACEREHVQLRYRDHEEVFTHFFPLFPDVFDVSVRATGA